MSEALARTAPPSYPGDVYRDECNAVRSGVNIDIKRNGDLAGATPRMLRSDLTILRSDYRALVQLLIAKGLFTQAEYVDAIGTAIKQDADDYRRKLDMELT